MKNAIKRISKVVLSTMLFICFAFSNLAPVLHAKAATSTVDNPIIYTITSSIESDGIHYQLAVSEVYDSQNYQSFTLTYPSELVINFPSSLSTTWSLMQNTTNSPKSMNAIIKTGSRTPANLKTDLNGIYFTLATPNVYPPDGSTVTLTAASTKVTFFQDERGYAHYYEFINSTSATWTQAYNAAKNATRQDPRYPEDPSKKLHGYLATITSEEEQMQVYSAIADECGWLGGTRMVHNATGKAKIQDDASISTTISDFDTGTTNGKEWYWTSGPEAWTVYDASANSGAGGYEYYKVGQTKVTDTEDPNYNKNITPLVFYDRVAAEALASQTVNHAPKGVYQNFNQKFGFTHVFNANKEFVGKIAGTGIEPNNSSTEYVLQFAFASGSVTVGGVTTTKPDTWNDYAQTPGTAIKGYFIEYGGQEYTDDYLATHPGYQNDPKINELGGSGITTTSEVELVQPVVVEYRSTVQNPDTSYRKITSIGTSYDRLVTYETHYPYTAVRNTPEGAANIPGYTAYGYQFFGNNIDKGNLTVNASGDVSGVHSTSTQAIVFLYQPNQYTLTFNANYPGWTSANVSPANKNIYYDTPYGPLAVPTRTGYTFDGWYTTSGGGTLVTNETVLTATSNQTVYAHWTENSNYNVQYDLNGGIGIIVDLTNVSWSDNNLLAVAPSKSGYIFTGWDVVQGGAKQGVTNSNKYSDLASNDGISTIVLQAQWMEENRIIVKYHLNGATSPSSMADVDVAVTDLVDLPSLTKTGFTFGGWRLANDGAGNSSGSAIEGSPQYQDLAAQDAQFIILEAIWTPKTYIVNYDKNDLEETPSPYGSAKTGVTWSQNGLVPPDGVGNPTWNHHVFIGWNTSPTGNGVATYEGTTYSQIVNGVDSTSSVTLYAQWIEESTYTVVYDANGGTPSSIASKTVYLDDDDLLPSVVMAPPTGYDFACWNVTANGTKAGVTGSDTFGDLATDPNVGYIILQAQYTPKSGLTVSYNLNGSGGTAIPNKTGVVWTQTHLLPLADPTWAGHVFLGWNTLSTGLGTSITQQDNYGILAGGNDSLSTVTLYAQWASTATYNVMYNLNGGTSPIGTPIVTVQLPSVSSGVPAPVPVAPSGYTFTNWTVEDNGYGQGTPKSPLANGTTPYSDLVYGGAGSPAGYIKLIANYTEKNNFTVIYDLNYTDAPLGGTVADVAWSQTGFVPHIAYQPGKNLVGWTTDQAGQNLYVQPTTQYKNLVNSDDLHTSVTLYAQWEDARFYVNYDLNGINPPNGNHNYDQKVVAFDDTNLVPPSLQRTGYTLIGWNVSVNGFKQNVQQTDSFRTLANSGAVYITLQAQWSAKEYVVNYDLNGGHLGPEETLTSRDVRWWTDNLLPQDITVSKNGYTFLGWKLSALEETLIDSQDIESSEFINNGDKYSDLAEESGYDNASITLKAIFQENAPVTINYTVKTMGQADSNGGSVTPATQSIGPATGTASSTATENAGYHIIGWFEASDTEYDTMLTDSLTFNPDKVGGLNVSGSYVVLFAEDADVTINYSVKTVEQADGSGGSISKTTQSIGPATGTAGSTATPNTGYHLVGWYEAIDAEYDTLLSDELTFSPDKVGGVNVAGSYVALFAEDENVTINYAIKTIGQADSVGGGLFPTEQSIGPATGTAGSNATANTGYHLVGWYEANDTSFINQLSDAAIFNPAKVEGLNVAGSYIALFEENTNVTITYSATTGGSVSPDSQSIGPATGTASSTATANAGYHLVGWYEASDEEYEIMLSDELTFSPDKVGSLNVSGSYIAVFVEDPNVTITYSATIGGSVSPTTQNIGPATGVASSTATANVGYHLVGWYASSDTEYTDMLSDELTFSSDKVNGLNVAGSYIAVFAEDSNVTINYSVKTSGQADSNGGSVSLTTQSIGPATGSASSTATANAGYHLVGWYEASDTEYADILSDELTFCPDKVSELNVAGSYVALFEEDTDVTIAYSATTGGLVSPTTQSIGPATGTAGSTAITNAGYHLVGWYASSDTEYDTMLGDELAFSPGKVDGLNVAGNYIALFEEDPNVTITYSATVGGSVSSTTQSIGPATGTASSTATANAGYHLVGWYEASDEEFETKLSGLATFSPDKVGGLNVSGSYIALFEENPNISISYAVKTTGQADSNGGSASPTTQSIGPATGTASSTATANAGYHLVGWYASSDTEYTDMLSDELIFSPDKVGGLNVTGSYVALFEEDENITINYSVKTIEEADATGGSVSPTTQSIGPVTGAASSTATANSGYHLVGWYEASDTEYDTILSDDLTFNPAKVGGLNVAGNYIALFAENADITIKYATKTVEQKNSNGGSVTPKKQNIGAVTGVASSTATPKEGYHLVGWYEASDTEYADILSDELTFNPDKVGGLNVAGSYVALFAEDENVTITYSATAGGTVSPTTQSIGPATGVASSTATADSGYHLVGWYVASDEEFEDLLSSELTFSPSKVGGLNIEKDYVALFEKDSKVSAPPAPQPESKTTTSITLVPIPGAMYSIDGGKTWQVSNTFKGLKAGTIYTFVAYYPAKPGYEASAISKSTKIKTSRSGWNPFKDIYGGQNTWDENAPWYYTAVQFMYDNKLTNGTSATAYSPNSGLSRRAYVTFLWRLDGAKKNTYKTPFKDVSNTAKDDMSVAIRWAYNKKITSGMTKTTFAPMANVSRQAMSAFTYRYQTMNKKVPKDLSDKVNEYKKVTDKNKINPSLATAVQKCFYQGQLRLNGTKVNPTAKATRADVAYAIYYFLTGIGWAE